MNKIKNYFYTVTIIFIISLIATCIGISLFFKGFEFAEAPLIIIGPLLIIFGFYGVVVCGQRIYIAYTARKIAELIENNRRATVAGLAKEFNKTTTQIDKILMFLIKGEFVEGFYYNHLEIEKIQDREAREKQKSPDKAVAEASIKIKAEDENQQIIVKKHLDNEPHNERCQNCGANVSFKGRDGICPYCGNLVIPREHK